MRIFLDANILFSAAKSEGAIARLISLLLEGGHVCCADEYVLEEARRNLAVRYPKGSLLRLEALKGHLEVASVLSSDSEVPSDIALVEKDRPVLASALSLRCDALLTGDQKHFGHLYGRRIHCLTVHSPLSLAELLIPR